MSDDLNRLLDVILPEDILDREGLEYRLTRGSRGEQLNVQECPFCGGDGWKVYINRDSGLGNCFHGSCGETFNKFGLIRRVLGDAHVPDIKRYLDAITRELGYRPRRTGAKQAGVDTDTDWKMPDSYALPTRDGRNLMYLEERGIDASLCKEFHLRWCMEGWFNFTKPDGNQGGSDFSNRTLIPVFDLDGRLVTFQGRDLTGKAERKYLFPPGLPGTSRFLLNGQNAAGARTAILGEGPFDVMAIRRAIRERDQFADMIALGSFGMNLSMNGDGDDQLHQLLRLKGMGLREVRVMWDGEKHAWEKAVAAAAKIARHGLRASVCRLPENTDPADVPAEVVRDAIVSAVAVTPKSAIMLRLKNPYISSQS